MQVGSPRGAERWIIKDGVMNDGRIVARQITGYFDAGAYTRLSSYAVIKCVGHLPGPLHDPERVLRTSIASTPTARRRPPCAASASPASISRSNARWTSWPSLSAWIPIEFRILNAYRDGDMKAHRREANNCALIECVQVAAEKARLADPRRVQAHEFISQQTARPRQRRLRRPHPPAPRPTMPEPKRPPPRGNAAAANAAPCLTCHRARGTPPTLQPVATARQRARNPSRRLTTPSSGGRATRRPGVSRFSSYLRHQEALMAKHRGRGVATINYPIGMNLGGDPSQALVHSNPTASSPWRCRRSISARA